MNITTEYITNKLSALNPTHVFLMGDNLRLYSIVVLVAVLVRWLVAQFPYSGFNNPPLYGDFEAQRHWMEITTNLNAKDWYQNSSLNDLQYWGLDYPPLTAYHMYICGTLIKMLNSTFMELKTSHGLEDIKLKFVLRLSVFISDLFIFIPSVIWFVLCTNQNAVPSFYQIYRKKALGAILLSSFLMYPGFILIDHGHFQYNCVPLGLVVASVCAFGQDWNLLGSVLFILSLNYKQMSLYFALPFFFYLLGFYCSSKNFVNIVLNILRIACVVITLCALIWWPFLDNINSVLNRIFPFYRGVFEDKVASFWCTFNILLKLKKWEQSKLIFICSFITLISSLPSCLYLFIKPTLRNLILTLFNVSICFFLFSYHVHEKSILFPALPACMLLASYPLPSFWFLNMSVISLFPLIAKDGLIIAFFGTLFTYYFLCVHIFQIVDTNEMPIPKLFLKSTFIINKYISFRVLTKLCFYSSEGMGLLLCLFSIMYKAPQQYPDLFSVAISSYCSLHFILFYVLFNFYQFSVSFSIDQCKNIFIKKKA